jgi:outer membrane protein assembly factor BamB
VDGERLICLACGKDSIAVAFNKNTGAVIWKKLSASEPGYAPPMLFHIGGKPQLIVWHPQSVNSLNPESGDLYWSQPFVSAVKKKGKSGGASLGAGMSIPSPRLAGDSLFLTCFYDGSLMLKLNGTDKPSVVWKGAGKGETPEKTDGLHCVMNTPYLKDGHIYGVCSYGELRCIKADSGERKWETFDFTTGKALRWGNAFLVQQGDRTILFNEGGDLIIAKLTPEKAEEISRANILTPTNKLAAPAGRRVIWSHPAFANRCVYARSDAEIVCVSMAKE